MIAIDGINHVGKSSLVSYLFDSLSGTCRVTTTRALGDPFDPQLTTGGGNLSEAVTSLAPDGKTSYDDIERQMMLASLLRRHNRVTLPLLQSAYDIVLSDRSSASAWSYAAPLGAWFENLVAATIGCSFPEHLILWLDLEPALAYARWATERAARGTHPGEAIFQKGIEYQEQVRAVFVELWQRGLLTRIAVNEGNVRDSALQLVRAATLGREG